MSSPCYSVLLSSGEIKLGLIEFPWVLLSSDEFKRGLNEFRWVLSEFLWVLVSCTEFLCVLLSSSEFNRASESSQWVVVSTSKLYYFLDECKRNLHASISILPQPPYQLELTWWISIYCLSIHIYMYVHICLHIDIRIPWIRKDFRLVP